MIEVSVTVLNASEIRRKLEDPNFIGVPVAQLLPRVRQLGLNTARQALQGRGTGLAVQSLFASYSVPRAQVRVFSAMPIATALSVERGSPIGTVTLYGRLAKWKRATGDPRPVAVIQAQIKAGGSPALRYLGQAADAIRARMPEYMRELAEKFRRKWTEA